MNAAVDTIPPSQFGEPVWEIARLFPEQGSWLEADYLSLRTKLPVEFDAGVIEVPPALMKSDLLVQGFLLYALGEFTDRAKTGGGALGRGFAWLSALHSRQKISPG